MKPEGGAKDSCKAREAAELNSARGGSGSRAEVWRVVRRYGMGVLCVGIAFGIRYWLGPILGEELPFMLFVAAALVAAWYGGAVVGIVALGLGLMLASWFFLPGHGFRALPHTGGLVQLIRYFFTSLLGIVLIEVLHRDRRRTECARQELEREVARREGTERALREAEKQLREYSEELERRVAERTERLADTVGSLREMVYHIAHNLRGPLRAMEGYSAVLIGECEGRLAGTAREHLEHIQEAAMRMDQLVQDLIEYGRLGHQEVALSRVSLQRVVEKVIFDLDYEISTRRGEVRVASPLPDVRGQAEILEQVLSNLVENGLKFVAPGQRPQLRIWAEERGSTVRLLVEDNGIGIDPAYHERIFGMFESLHPRQSPGGTGMGLAMVKRGAERLGGRVGVESRPGEGSRFWVELPAAGPVARKGPERGGAGLRLSGREERQVMHQHMSEMHQHMMSHMHSMPDGKGGSGDAGGGGQEQGSERGKE